MTGMRPSPMAAKLQQSLIRAMAVALLLSGGAQATVRAVEPAVELVLKWLINRFIRQAGLNATPLRTDLPWGDSVTLAILAVGFLWLGIVLGLLLFPDITASRKGEARAVSKS